MIQNIKISKKINAETENVATYTPPAGKIVQINTFRTSGTLSYRLYWKYQTEEEELIWSEGIMILPHNIPDNEVNGENQFAIVIENNTNEDQYASAIAIIQVEDPLPEEPPLPDPLPPQTNESPLPEGFE